VAPLGQANACGVDVRVSSMEVVWHGKFNELFASFPHPWSLKPTDAAVEHATVFNDSAKVRFLCKVSAQLNDRS